MKKRISSLLLICLLLACIPVFAGAESPAQDFPHVLDNAGLLSESERASLENTAAALSERCECSLYIVTVQDFTELDSDVREAAMGIYRYYELGWGEGHDGVILLLSMADRDFCFAGYGKGETICDGDSGFWIEDQFLDNFRSNDWYGGFEDYLTACGEQLRKLEAGEDLGSAEKITGDDGLDYHSYNYEDAARRSREEKTARSGAKILVIVIVPLLAALVTCSIFKAQMKTARAAARADRYLKPRSLNLRVKEDVFTHRTEHREVIETDSGTRSGGHSGGGSSSFHSGGFSGRSGKF